MAENQIDGDVIGLAMDGTGFGMDGNAWGGEFLVANETEFKRLGHLQYFVLPGGEKAIHEPWRMATSLLALAYGQSWPDIAEQLDILPAGMDSKVLNKIIENKINSPLTSGLGRLFDGVAAIIGLRKTVSFEGQAAMELEGESDREAAEPFPFTISGDADSCLILDISSTIRAIVNDLLAGKNKKEISSSFHRTLVVAFVAICERIREKIRIDKVCLSGGCFQNKILLEDSISIMEKAGFVVYHHKQVPTNDGGIALGQAVIAGAMAKK
jgi:hydrogenase maturation protein HypF